MVHPLLRARLPLLALVLVGAPACVESAPGTVESPEETRVSSGAQALVASCDEQPIRDEAPASAIPFLDRAFDWVHAGAMYCQCVTDATAPYRADCSGLVSHAWDLAAPGHTTYSFAGGPWDDGQSVVIGWDELTVGDALNFPGDPNQGVGHIMLFGGWLNADHTDFCAVEESSTGTPAHISQHSVSNPGSWWGGSGSFGDIFLPIRLAGYAPTPPNQAPHGWLDSAACDEIRGWAQDQDTPDQPIDVHLYFDGSPGDPSAKAFAVHADQSRDDLCQAIGSCNHGFSAATPRSLLDGQPHTVQAFGIDSAGGSNPLLAGSPQTIQCDAPAPPLDAQHGIKRWVTSPTVFDAWHFDWFRDLAQEPDAVVSSFPDGPVVPDAPVVVRADGAPEVWVIDSGVRRHVIDPTSLGAWHFDGPDSVVVKTAAEIDAYPIGADFPASPFVFASPSDPKVYILDVAFQDTGSGNGGAGAGGGSANGGNGAAGDIGSGGDGAAAGAGADETRSRSASCATSGAPVRDGLAGVCWVAMGLIAARRRRRGALRS